MAPLPSKKQKKRPHLKQNGPVCAPFQTCLKHVPVITFDIGKWRRKRRFIYLIKKRLLRARKIGPGCYCNRPITPLYNPQSPKTEYTEAERAQDPNLTGINPASGHSFHIVELVQSKVSSMKVQLVIRDYDQYLLGFRRYLKGQWSSWYRVSDILLPDYFQAVNIGVHCAYKDPPKIGGTMCLQTIFCKLGAYPDQDMNKSVLHNALLCAAVVFCETMRLGRVFREMLKHLERDVEPTEIDDISWDQIKNWGKISEYAISIGTGKADEDLTMRKMKRYGIDTFEQLICVKQSELFLLMRKDAYLIPDGLPAKLKRKNGAEGRLVMEILGKEFQQTWN